MVDNARMKQHVQTQSASTWHVLGTGAMACLWAAQLRAAGHPVHLIARHPEAREEYHGITLETAGQTLKLGVHVQAAQHPGPIAQLLVCTKAQDTLHALQQIRHRLAADACVVLLQNGMGFHDQAQQLLAPARLFCALTTEGAWMRAPFHVVHAGVGHTLLGAYPVGDSELARELREQLPCERLDIRADTDIASAMWRKLAVNCAINALTAVHQCPNGALLQDATITEEFNQLCAEISAILHAAGQSAVAAEVLQRATEVATRTAANRSSMLQDVTAGRRTEIDYINGFLCQLAAEAGADCRLNAALCQQIHALEQPG
jgi:2-dehydropantoate 2-reductase